MLDRVDPLSPQPAGVAGKLAGALERHISGRAEAKISLLALQHEAVDPRPRPAGSALEIEPIAVGVHAGGCVLDLFCRQFAHDPTTLEVVRRNPRIYPRLGAGF